jgi:hypothetical protein
MNETTRRFRDRGTSRVMYHSPLLLRVYQLPTDLVRIDATTANSYAEVLSELAALERRLARATTPWSGPGHHQPRRVLAQLLDQGPARRVLADAENRLA